MYQFKTDHFRSIFMGDIGKDPHEVEFEPLPEGVPEPVHQPVREPAPAAVPEKEPEKVPA